MQVLLCGPEWTQCSLWASISPLVKCAGWIRGSSGTPAVLASMVSSLDRKAGGEPVSVASQAWAVFHGLS